MRKLKNFRKLLSLALVCTSLSVSGCTVTANRVYSVCKISDGVTYCYNDEDKFFLLREDGVFAPTSSVGLRALPALHVIPSGGSFQFEEQLPGLYTGTLASVNHYVERLQTDLGSTFEMTYCDWNNIEGHVESAELSVRIVYNITGQVRIYAIDANGDGIVPPYISKESD